MLNKLRLSFNLGTWSSFTDKCWKINSPGWAVWVLVGGWAAGLMENKAISAHPAEAGAWAELGNIEYWNCIAVCIVLRL